MGFPTSKACSLRFKIHEIHQVLMFKLAVVIIPSHKKKKDNIDNLNPRHHGHDIEAPNTLEKTC